MFFIMMRLGYRDQDRDQSQDDVRLSERLDAGLGSGYLLGLEGGYRRRCTGNRDPHEDHHDVEHHLEEQQVPVGRTHQYRLVEESVQEGSQEATDPDDDDEPPRDGGELLEDGARQPPRLIRGEGREAGLHYILRK